MISPHDSELIHFEPAVDCAGFVEYPVTAPCFGAVTGAGTDELKLAPLLVVLLPLEVPVPVDGEFMLIEPLVDAPPLLGAVVLGAEVFGACIG
jgi:hypothetical protein